MSNTPTDEVLTEIDEVLAKIDRFATIAEVRMAIEQKEGKLPKEFLKFGTAVLSVGVWFRINLSIEVPKGIKVWHDTVFSTISEVFRSFLFLLLFQGKGRFPA